jgi:hypothetical protein
VNSEGHTLHLQFCEYILSISNPPSHALHAFVCAGTLPVSEKAKVKTYRGPPSEETAAAEVVAGGGEDGKEEEGGAEEKETAAGVAAVAAGGGGGSRPRKTLPVMDPEEALRAFAESVGMPVYAMWAGVARGDGGEIVEIVWQFKDLKGTLPVGDMHMPYLRRLNLRGNRELKGEAEWVGVEVVKFTDCFCE